MTKEEFRSRRDQLIKEIGSHSAAILFAAQENLFGVGVNYPYQQDSDFYYLTGFVEPDSVAVLIPGSNEGEFILFNRRSDPEKELWYGSYAGQGGACRDFGADRSFPISEIDTVLPRLLAGRETIYSNLHPNDPRYQKIKRSDKGPSSRLVGIGKFLHKMRLKKSKHELDIIRRAVEITTKGHLRAMQKCRPGIYEYELEAELLYEFNRGGMRFPPYENIVASGVNACTLHYSKNSKKMVAGELVLVDAGVKYGNYCTDVTRTFPVDGSFTPEQRAIYEIVLKTQKEVIKGVRPGVLWSDLQVTADRTITEGLVDIGLLQGGVDSLLEQKSFKRFFMHKIGGLDTHDVGDYIINNQSVALEPGMLFTVEPGIYISPASTDIDDRWKGIGVRIEDDILVIDSGSEILTKEIPSDIVDLENLKK